jgi:hypothetical protein
LQSGTHTGVTVRWRTDEPTESIVYYGKEADDLHFIVGDIEPTTEHIVEIAGLDPETKYFYSVGDLVESLASGPDFFFITHPVPGTIKPTRIWVIGDCGTFNTGAGNQVGVRDAYYAYAGSRLTDVWLALGDNAYNSGTDAEYQANFFGVYPALLRQTVVWPTLGNHETYSPPDGDQLPYFNMFSLPSGGEAGGLPSGTEKYYSFDYANIHFVCLDSELSDRTTDGAMLTWLKADLEANTRDWLIAYWHSPPYSKGSHDSDNLFDNFGNMTEMRENAVRILESYGVDLVMCGHSHIYERSYLINGHYGFSDSLEPAMIKDAGSGKPEDTGAYLKLETGPEANQGAVYLVAGCSGWATFRTGVHPIMYFDELQTGSVVIDISGSRLDAKFLRETGAIDDYFSIIKGAAPENLRICTFAMNDDETVVRWKSRPGKRYLVERSASLQDPDWSEASPPIVATGATTTWSGPLPKGMSQSFYRVVALRDLPPAPESATEVSKKAGSAGKRSTRLPAKPRRPPFKR